jgi:hypothetical protein
MKKLICTILVIVMIFPMSSAAFASNNIISHTSMARDVLYYTNLEREARGLRPLVWQPELVDFANTRSREIMTHWSHTRPNGRQATDTSGVHGENLARGPVYTAREVVEGWMNSPSHRENILRPQFTGMAVSCLEAPVVIQGHVFDSFFWTQLFHVDVNAPPWNPQTAQPAAQLPAGSYAKSSNVDANGAVIQDRIYNEARNAAAGTTARIVNASYIKSATVTHLAQIPNVAVAADTTTADNRSIQGRMLVRPADLRLTGDRLALGVWTESIITSSISESLGRWYSNRLAVVKFDQQGELGARVQIAARVDLTGLNTNTLVFYSFDQASNRLIKLSDPGYTVDQNGFLHFSTNLGGSIIITDRDLARR